MNILEKANEMCKFHNAELLYLIPFGSKLYGTNIENSDSDFKGVFLPSLESLILENAPHHISFSTSNDNEKCNENDIEIELFSLQKFVKKLVGSGQTIGIDMIFAKDHSLYINEYFQDILNNPFKFWNIQDSKAFTEYAKGQAVKFSVKGERLDIVEGILKECDRLRRTISLEKYDNLKLGDELSYFARFCDGNFCKIIESIGANNKIQQFFYVLGKQYMFSMTLKEFHKKISGVVKSYGKRAQSAKDADGFDKKAVYHAIRVLYELNELVENKSLNFPLKNKKYLLEIRNGKVSYDEVMNFTNIYLEKINKKLENIKEKTKDEKYIKNFILSFYKENLF